MALSPSTIQSAYGSKRSSKRVGRGNSSQKGTSAGKGTKGQRARSGGRPGLERLGYKRSLQQAPKFSGFNSLKAKANTVSLFSLNRLCSDGDVVTPLFLERKGSIASAKRGVKIVASGILTKKLTIKDCKVSAGAKELIIKAGGTVL